MAKSLLKLKTRKLRKEGRSIKDIAKKLSVSSSSVSMWCRDIELSRFQIEKLIKSKKDKITAGRLKGALIQRTKKLERIKNAEKEAEKLNKLTKKQFFVAGLTLYLAEGSKNMGRVQFTNSDPKIIKFELGWFKRFFNITEDKIKFTILINKAHKKRELEIKKFWKDYLKLKTNPHYMRYTKTKSKKVYENANKYFGVFSFRINKSSYLLYRINALNSRLLEIQRENN